jgi:hypothetical protein
LLILTNKLKRSIFFHNFRTKAFLVINLNINKTRVIKRVVLKQRSIGFNPTELQSPLQKPNLTSSPYLLTLIFRNPHRTKNFLFHCLSCPYFINPSNCTFQQEYYFLCCRLGGVFIVALYDFTLYENIRSFGPQNKVN